MNADLSPDSDASSPPLLQEVSHQQASPLTASLRSPRHSQDVINAHSDARQQHLGSSDDADTATRASDAENTLSSLNGQDQSPGYKPVATDDQAASSIIGRKNSTSVTTIISDCIAVFLPMGTVIFGALVWSLDGSEIDENFSAWQDATTIVGYIQIHNDYHTFLKSVKIITRLN